MCALWQKAEESIAQQSRSLDHWNERVPGSYEANQSVASLGNQENRVESTSNVSVAGPSGLLVLLPDMKPKSDIALQNLSEIQSESSKINGTLKAFPGGTPPTDNIGFLQVSSPAITSLSPGRYFTSTTDCYYLFV